MHYALDRSTGDLDVFHAIPYEAAKWLTELAGRDSAIHKRHKLCVHIASAGNLPHDYGTRLSEMFPGVFRRLRLLVVDPYDLALSKLERNFQVDFEDVKHLAQSKNLDLEVLEGRYREELRPYVVGPTERHDQTLALWIEAIREQRNAR
jgi:hypothetical protein